VALQPVDPVEAIQESLAVSAAWIELMGSELQRAVDAADGDVTKALVGSSYVVTPDGKRVKTGEYMRTLAYMEQRERENYARLAAQAIKLDIRARNLVLQQAQAGVIAARVLEALELLELTPGQRRTAAEVVPAQLSRLSG